jgi:hypothetical protein
MDDHHGGGMGSSFGGGGPGGGYGGGMGMHGDGGRGGPGSGFPGQMQQNMPFMAVSVSTQEKPFFIIVDYGYGFEYILTGFGNVLVSMDIF